MQVYWKKFGWSAKHTIWQGRLWITKTDVSKFLACIYIYIETAYFNQDSQKTHWWWLMKACSRHIPTVNIPFFHASAQPPSAGEAHEGWDSTVWTIFANPSRVARLSKFPWKFGYDETALCVPPNIIFGSRRFVFAEDLENLRHGWAPLSSDVRQVLKGRTLEDSWDLDPEFLLNSCGAHPDEQMGVWDVYFPHQMGSKVVPTVFFCFFFL